MSTAGGAGGSSPRVGTAGGAAGSSPRGSTGDAGVSPGASTGPGGLRLIRSDALSGATAQTSGMVRSAAISGELTGASALWMGRSELPPGVNSGDHHHGESETGIYVVSGTPVFAFRDPASGEVIRLEAQPGDYIWVPPWVPHREENPSPDETAVIVLARSTQEAIVVNVDAL